MSKKAFNSTLYALITFVVMAALLSTMTVLTFKSKYIAFDEEKLAGNYVDSIVQSGDGYNAYKYTLLSINDKYGDYIRKHYIYPLVYPGYEIGMDTGDLAGYDDSQYESDATANDDGTLAGQLADAMYPYYEELMAQYGWDDYDTVFTNYFNTLVTERQQIFGDEYLSDEVMFTALEANVSTYGDRLTGTTAVTDEDSGVTTGEDTTGLYQTLYGNDYKITTAAAAPESVSDVSLYVATLDEAALEACGITASDISDACTVEVTSTLADGTVVLQQTVYEVKVGNTWYVDNITTNTVQFYSNINSEEAV